MVSYRDFTDFLVAFIDFLNQNGYHARADQAGVIQTAIMSSGLPLDDEAAIAGILNSFLSGSRDEYEKFSTMFQSFYRQGNEEYKRQKEEEKKLQEKRKKQEEKRNAIESQVKDIESKMQWAEDCDSRRRKMLKELKAQRDAKAKELNASREERYHRTKSAASTLAKNAKSIEKKLDCSGEAGKLLKSCLTPETDIPFRYCMSDYEKAKKCVQTMMKNALAKNNLQEASACKSLFDCIKGMEKAQKEASKKSDTTLKRIDQEIQQYENELNQSVRSKERLERQLMEAERQRAEIQQALDNLEEKEMDIAQKAGSLVHREEFLPTGNAVQSTFENGELTKKFDKLSETERTEIERYIDDNLLKFRTRMTRNVRSLCERKTDVKETVRRSCQTDGIPMRISYKKPRPSRAKLVLILDISGSCKSASNMMLFFMHRLQSAFPGGCRTFAFVNQIYDISFIMKSGDSAEATEGVMRTIQTKGVYSDYGRPISQLAGDYRTCFTKDTIVIWMGDFRNNQNDTCKAAFKDISRKVKKVYLLNTETRDKWDKADSVFSVYDQYASQSYEVVNTEELIQFITDFR